MSKWEVRITIIYKIIYILKEWFIATGHSSAEAAKLCNYLHFRRAERQYEKTILQRANLERSIDFMDSIDDDIPKGNLCTVF